MPEPLAYRIFSILILSKECSSVPTRGLCIFAHFFTNKPTFLPFVLFLKEDALNPEYIDEGLYYWVDEIAY